jgi:putative methyltransferase
MGKKNKKSALEEPVMEVQKTEDPADDDALIPYHTKQASFALLFLLFFSILMFTLPFGAFYGTKHILQEYFHLDTFQTTCWSVLAAVFTVNIVIGLYAIFGFLEAKKEEAMVKQHVKSKAN